ncbi:MAG: NRDE family protein [Pseudomonadota bacterium]
MCLALVALNAAPELPFLMIGNRDEFHARPTAAADWWADQPGLLAGRDLTAGGTWYGLTRHGRFGLITNFREKADGVAHRSRGALLADFLAGTEPAETYANNIDGDAYAGFNLLIGGAPDDAFYVSNRSDDPVRPLSPGIHAVSNALLDTPWPKLLHVRGAVADWLASGAAEPEQLFGPLRDSTQANEGDTPELDLPPGWHRALTAPFIIGEDYGTRSTSLAWVRPDGRARYVERRYRPDGNVSGQTRETFSLEAA